MIGNTTTTKTPGRTILPGDRVLVYDAGRYRWHQVADVLLGKRVKIRVAGAQFHFDEALVARHESNHESKREVRA